MTAKWPGGVPAQPGPAVANLAAPGPTTPRLIPGDPGNGSGPHRAAAPPRREARCDYSDLPVSSCSHCTGRTGDAELLAALAHENRAEQEWSPPGHNAPAGPWLTAQFHGKCQGCPDRITPGMQIRRSAAGGWLCPNCGDNDEGDSLP